MNYAGEIHEYVNDHSSFNYDRVKTKVLCYVMLCYVIAVVCNFISSSFASIQLF